MTGSATCGIFYVVPALSRDPQPVALLFKRQTGHRRCMGPGSEAGTTMGVGSRSRDRVSRKLSYAMATDLSLCEKKRRFNSAAGFAELNR